MSANGPKQVDLTAEMERIQRELMANIDELVDFSTLDASTKQIFSDAVSDIVGSAFTCQNLKSQNPCKNRK